MIPYRVHGGWEIEKYQQKNQFRRWKMKVYDVCSGA